VPREFIILDEMDLASPSSWLGGDLEHQLLRIFVGVVIRGVDSREFGMVIDAS